MVAKYPAIPEPTIEPTSLRDAVLSLKQAFEILTGQRGNPDYAALTFGDVAPEVVSGPSGPTTANAVDVTVTPAGNIASANVQAALVELDTEKVAKAGDTMTGHLSLPITPAAANAVRKDYVDTATALLVAKAGDTMTGHLFLPTAPAAANAVRKDYVDAADSAVAAAAAVFKKNYVLNGAMMVSQENGSTSGTTSNYHPVDQFAMGFNNAGTQTTAQVASVTPTGSPNRLRVTATAADASVAAGDFCLISQKIEGLRITDLMLGTASAKTITIAFGVKAPAGTYYISLQNSVTNRSYLAPYVISGGEANTDVRKSVTIALDQSGTWLKDTGLGMYVIWTLMAGSALQGAASTWQAGNFFGTSSQFNFMGTASNVFELFDVSLTEGTVAPPFVVPDYVSELALCKRYWQLLDPLILGCYLNGAGQVIYYSIGFPEMRATPAVTLRTTPNVNGATYNVPSGQITNRWCRFDVVATTAGQIYIQNGVWTLNARL